MPGYYSTVARYYDMDTGDKTDDLLMYSRLAEVHGGPILDVGCGTGRVLLHLAQEEHEVHGIDNDSAMLERLDNRLRALPFLQERVTVHRGDVLTYNFPQRFRLILLTYNMLMHFHEQDDQLTLLRRLRAALHDDGLLVIDLPNAGEVFAAQDSDALMLVRSFIEPENGHLVLLQSVSHLDRTTQLLRAEWIYDEITADGTVKRTYTPHLLRYYFYPELCLLLRLSGFTPQEVYGDTEEGPFEDGCERLIVYARPEVS